MLTNDLPSYLREEGNLLEPAWTAGAARQRYLKSLKSVKKRKFPRSLEIEAVDILASCKKVQSLLTSHGMRHRQLLVSSPSYVRTTSTDIVSFKDVTRLSFGLTTIFSQQVDNLLDDTEKLLNQMKQCKSIFEVPPKPISTKNRKRKITTTMKTEVKVSKRQRVDESKESLDIYQTNYYTDMLTECLKWNNIKSTEFEHMCQTTNTSEHNITMQDVMDNEVSKGITLLPDENEGFGDSTADDIGLTITQSLFSKRNSKRPAQDQPSDNLCHKKSRSNSCIGESVPENAIIHNNVEMSSDCYMPPPQEMVPEITSQRMAQDKQSNYLCHKSLQSDSNGENAIFYDCKIQPQEGVANFLKTPVRQQNRLNTKKVRQSKLIIDECIKFSRECLLEHRAQYHKQLCLSKPKVPKIYPGAKQLLSGLIYGKIKHKHLDKTPKLTRNQMDKDNESTLRAIFGNDSLAKEIFQTKSTQLSNETSSPRSFPTDVKEVPKRTIIAPPITALQPTHPEKELERPMTPLPFTILQVAQPYQSDEEIVAELSPDNNNIYTPENVNLNIDSAFSVMQKLLWIWRNTPELKEIDVNNFLKFSQTRKQVALIFYYLLCLSCDHFICISKKRGTLQMDKIALGSESTALILDVSLYETH